MFFALCAFIQLDKYPSKTDQSNRLSSKNRWGIHNFTRQYQSYFPKKFLLWKVTRQSGLVPQITPRHPNKNSEGIPKQQWPKSSRYRFYGFPLWRRHSTVFAIEVESCSPALVCLHTRNKLKIKVAKRRNASCEGPFWCDRPCWVYVFFFHRWRHLPPL